MRLSPWWYFVGTGLVVGAASVVVILAPGIPAGIAVIVLAVALTALDAARQRVQPSKQRWNRKSTLAAFLLVGVFAIGFFLTVQLGLTWIAWVTGAMLFLLTVVFGLSRAKS